MKVIKQENRKILYLTRYALDQEFHLKKKFDGQITAFKNLGFDVYYIAFDRNYIYLVHNNKKTVFGKTHFWIPSYFHTQFYNDLHRTAIKAIKEIGFDYLYWRASPLFRSSCKVAETAKAYGTTFILEIPTFPNREAPLSSLRKLYTVYANRFSKKYNELIDYYVLIGEDAGGSYNGKTAVNIENGIDLGSLKIRKPIFDDDAIHIIALASMSYWHGYDRLIKSLAEYHGNHRIIIHMVGGNEGGSLLEWKDLVHQLQLDNKVIFHGSMFGDDLDDLIDKCDLGAAAFGIYRKHFSYISELKTREYTARCLPFILSAEDVIISKAERKFWVQITNDDTIPDMNDIVDFALRMRKEMDILPYMRAFAENNLTWETQYLKLFRVIEEST